MDDKRAAISYRDVWADALHGTRDCYGGSSEGLRSLVEGTRSGSSTLECVEGRSSCSGSRPCSSRGLQLVGFGFGSLGSRLDTDALSQCIPTKGQSRHT